MALFNVQVEDAGPVISRLTKTAESLSSIELSRQMISFMLARTKDRYILASKTTPFSPSSIGRRRPSGQIIGPGALFGIDSGANFRSLTGQAKQSGDRLIISSDLPQHRPLMAHFAEKGPFAPRSILFISAADRIAIRQLVSARVQRAAGRQGLSTRFDDTLSSLRSTSSTASGLG